MEPNLAILVGLLGAMALISFVSSTVQAVLFFKVLNLRDPNALEERMHALATSIEHQASAAMDDFQVFKNGAWRSHINQENQEKRKRQKQDGPEYGPERDNGGRTPEALARRLRGE